MKSKVILLTGGSGKFGQVMLNHFLNSGDTVITTCRSAKSAKTLRNRFNEFADRFFVVQIDFENAKSMADLKEVLSANKLEPEYLINNARNIKYLKGSSSGVVSRKNFANEFIMDVVVPYELSMLLYGLKRSQLKKIINIGSMYGSVAANPNLYTDPFSQSFIHYGVAKSALVHLTKELAVRFAPRNIQVNCIAYGGVEGRVDDNFKQRYAKLCPAGRMLKEAEIIGPLELLLSDSCSAITGHVIAADGGWSIW